MKDKQDIKKSLEDVDIGDDASGVSDGDGGGDSVDSTSQDISNDEVDTSDETCNEPQGVENEDGSDGSDDDEAEEPNPSDSRRDIYASDGCYYKRTGGRKPQVIVVSNFTLKVKAKVVFKGNWFHQCTGTVSDGEQFEIQLFRDDFLSTAAFSRALAVHSNLEYYGNNRDTTQIKGLLADQKPRTVQGTDKNGIHNVNDRLVYVEGDYAVDKDGPVSDIVFISKHSQAHRMPCLLSQPDISQADLNAIAGDLCQFNDSKVVFSVLGFIGYCFAKEAITSCVDYHNPFMMLHGESGSGKSQTIERIVIPIFSSRVPFANIGNETQYTLAHNSNETNLTPVCYDEYKNSVLTPSLKRMIDTALLSSYAQTPIERGRPGRSIANLRYTAPFIMAGEMTIESTSLDHRRIDVFCSCFGRKGTEDSFKRLTKQPLGSFGKALLYHTLKLGPSRLCQELDNQASMVTSSIDSRFRDNAAVIRTGLWLIINYLESKGIDASCYQQGFDIIDSAIKESFNTAGITNVDRIVSDLCTMANDGVLCERVDYEVKGDCLCLNIACVYAKYERWVRRKNNGVSEFIGKTSFYRQLAEKKYYLGRKTAKIGGQPRSAIKLDLSSMPDGIEMDWPGYNNFDGQPKLAS